VLEEELEELGRRLDRLEGSLGRRLQQLEGAGLALRSSLAGSDSALGSLLSLDREEGRGLREGTGGLREVRERAGLGWEGEAAFTLERAEPVLVTDPAGDRAVLV
jgi:hypothetical protein